MGSRTRILAEGRRHCSSSSSAKMRLRLLAALVLLAAFVNGEKMTWRNDEGNTCAVYYRFKRAMCDCGDQWGEDDLAERRGQHVRGVLPLQEGHVRLRRSVE